MKGMFVEPYPDPGLGEICPHGDLLPGAHVRVAVPLEGGLQLLQLLAGEVRPLPPLLLLLGVIGGPVVAAVLHDPLFLCRGVRKRGMHDNTDEEKVGTT